MKIVVTNLDHAADRRRWFFLCEGVAKRAALVSLTMKAPGPVNGLRALPGPQNRGQRT